MLTLDLLAHPLQPADRQPLYRSPFRGKGGESLGLLYRDEAGEVLCFPGAGQFRIGSDRIDGFTPPSEVGPAEVRLLGPVLSYWLERQGLPTLHASAVAVEGQAVGFLSRQGGGKTGLAAALVRAGYPLLTDDVLPLEEREGSFFARPGYPQMRMWPDEAAWFAERWQELPRVHPEADKRWVPIGSMGGAGFGDFLDATLPLACLYLPERRPAGPVEVHEISPRDALIELVRHSFAPRLVEAAGLQPFRFDFFARLVRSVPVRRLVYPSGFERLQKVVEYVANLPVNESPCAAIGEGAARRPCHERRGMR